MVKRISAAALGAVMALGAAAGMIRPAAAESFLEYSTETRFQLDFHVSDAALKAMLPAGWEPAVASAGPAKDANIRLDFIDRIAITGADGKPKGNGTNQLAYLAVPIRQTGTDVVGQMIVAGLTADPADAPGPFGVYLPTATHHMARSTKAGEGAAIAVQEDWDFTAATGEHVEVHIAYIRGPAMRGQQSVKFFSGKDPGVAQIAKIDQGLTILRNASVQVPDRVKSFSYKVSGGKLATLFDGTEKVLSYDKFAWYDRTIETP